MMVQAKWQLPHMRCYAYYVYLVMFVSGLPCNIGTHTLSLTQWSHHQDVTRCGESDGRAAKRQGAKLFFFLCRNTNSNTILQVTNGMKRFSYLFQMLHCVHIILCMHTFFLVFKFNWTAVVDWPTWTCTTAIWLCHNRSRLTVLI